MEDVADDRYLLTREIAFTVCELFAQRVRIKQSLCRMFVGSIVSVDDAAADPS